MQTERNFNSFQIQNLGVKMASKPINLHVKRAKTYGDLENTHFQSTLVTMLVVNQFFVLLNILLKYLWVFLVIGAPILYNDYNIFFQLGIF